MSTKIAYLYSPKDGSYIKPTVCIESPREKGVYLLPANATLLEPPEVGVDQTAVFASGVWIVKASARPEFYVLKDEKIAEVWAGFNIVMASPKTCGVVDFYPDQNSIVYMRIAIDHAVATSADSLDLYDTDNNPVSVNVVKARDVQNDLTAYFLAMDAYRRQLLVAVENAKTVAELDAIKIDYRSVQTE